MFWPFNFFLFLNTQFWSLYWTNFTIIGQDFTLFFLGSPIQRVPSMSHNVISRSDFSFRVLIVTSYVPSVLFFLFFYFSSICLHFCYPMYKETVFSWVLFLLVLELPKFFQSCLQAIHFWFEIFNYLVFFLLSLLHILYIYLAESLYWFCQII